MHVQPVLITTKVVNSNHTDSEVFSVQYYVIRFVSDLRQIGGFPEVIQFHPPITLTTMI